MAVVVAGKWEMEKLNGGRKESMMKGNGPTQKAFNLKLLAFRPFFFSQCSLCCADFVRKFVEKRKYQSNNKTKTDSRKKR